MTKQRDQQREKESQLLDKEKLDVTNARQEAEEQYENTKKLIEEDDEWRAQMQKKEDDKEAEE